MSFAGYLPADERPPGTPWRDWAIYWATTAVTAAVTAVATKGAEWAVDAIRERRKARTEAPK